MKNCSLLYAVDFDDEDKAREWTKKAAEAGDVESMEEMGREYRFEPELANFE